MKIPFWLLVAFGLAWAQGPEGLWLRACAVCHGEKAQGARGYPGLQAASSYWATPEGRRYLVQVILYGRKGKAGLMPGFYQLKDAEVAELLNLLKNLLGAKGEAFAPEEVAKERGRDLSPEGVNPP